MNLMMSESNPRLALDMYVLAQGVKTGVYRVCDELFPLLAHSHRFRPRLFYRPGDEARAAEYVLEKRLPAQQHASLDAEPSQDADILLSPFGVAPRKWLLDPRLLHAHIVYDLIGINRPDFFSPEAAAEVRSIVDSLDEHTVIFSISEFTKRDLLACRPDLSPRQVTVIPLAAGPSFRPCDDANTKSRVREKYGIPPQVPFVLSLATLEIRKNLDQVVNAFVSYLEQTESSPLHLVLSGMSGWKLEQLQGALAAAGRWRHRIVLTGFVEDEDLSALYSDALCFVYLSRYEGFGLPPLEAMACGTPVVCADNSSLPEVVGEAGLLLDADDVQGVADAIRKISASEEFRRELSLAGVERARLFSWERCAEIVGETLCSAYARHAERPVDRRPRKLAPGTLAAKYARPDGIVEANFLDYQNGSHGPRFPLHESRRPQTHRAGWPYWTDALPANSSRLEEGGLRTRGRFKTGTASMPLVTYVTVVRNNTATLSRTIESVQNQTYPNVEHVVLDGASTDGTLDLIRQYADRIDYYASERDKGLYDAVNKAIPLARGQLICVLNSDDWLQPDAAEIAVHRMGDCGGSAILLTAANVVQGGRVVQEWYPAFVHPGCYFMCANDCHNGIYATRAAYESSGPYDDSYKIVADFKWIMTCLEAAVTFTYTREVSVNYSLGGTSGDVRQHSMECMRVVGERFPFLTPTDISGLYHCFFLFAGAANLPDHPANRTEFLRDVFARHSSNPDFLSALSWASIEKLQHPADNQPIALPPGKAHIPPVNASAKEAVKAAPGRYPGAYTVVQRLYSSMLKR
ncbi:glycosyltransferase [Variovorax sp. MHTC-1]|nr:glycosyltransferase [Variovorax sp. MHTC-1]